MRTKFVSTIALTAALALATAFTLSCSDSGGGGGNSESIKKDKISGVFQKGPFVQGTLATLNELDSDLSPTGRPYSTLITDNKGTFEIRNLELVSPYAHLVANGFYRNEVTGDESKAQITLQAIVDLREKDQVNVNILTHLEYYRVLDLVDGGMTVKDAKKQAQKEIFAVFGINSDNFKDSEDMTIFGTSESDAALLAISILLLGDLSEAEFSQRLMDFSQAIKSVGNWNNEAKVAMANWAAGTSFWNTGVDTKAIRNNILRWGLASEIPAFEKYIYDYWVRIFGLGECKAETEWSVKKIASINEEWYFGHICRNGVWKEAVFENIHIGEYCLESGACGSFVDNRDGEKYRTSVIGTLNQTWIIEPLRYRGADGNLGVTYPAMRDGLRYVSLENAIAACPSGWHLPSDDEIRAIMPEECAVTESPEGYIFSYSQDILLIDSPIYWDSAVFWGNEGQQSFGCNYNVNTKVSWVSLFPVESSLAVKVYCIKD